MLCSVVSCRVALSRVVSACVVLRSVFSCGGVGVCLRRFARCCDVYCLDVLRWPCVELFRVVL